MTWTGATARMTLIFNKQLKTSTLVYMVESQIEHLILLTNRSLVNFIHKNVRSILCSRAVKKHWVEGVKRHLRLVEDKTVPDSELLKCLRKSGHHWVQ